MDDRNSPELIHQPHARCEQQRDSRDPFLVRCRVDSDIVDCRVSASKAAFAASMDLLRSRRRPGEDSLAGSVADEGSDSR